MSWDVFIMKFPAGCRALADVPNDWQPEGLGTPASIRAALDSVLPHVVWSDDGWGSNDLDGCSIEVMPPRVGKHDLVDKVTLLFRGGGDPVSMALAVAAALDGRALSSDGEFLETTTGTQSFERWRRWRDQAVRRPSKRSPVTPLER